MDCFCGDGIMTRIVLDPAMREKLCNLDQPLALCNEEGRVLAHLTPVYDPAEYGPLEPHPGDKPMKLTSKETRFLSALAREHNQSGCRGPAHELLRKHVYPDAPREGPGSLA